jgi:SAM-dependent methyltransferase
VGYRQRSPARKPFVPALGLRVLNPLFDPLVRLTMRERLFKDRLVAQMAIDPEHRILDVGSGTGTLALMIKRSEPGSEVVGLDPDPGILAIAGRKAERAGLKVRFEQGYGDQLPYPDALFDRVTSSLVFHHLTSDVKRRSLAEAFRVLRPGGEIHIADFGRPRNALMRAVSMSVRLLDGRRTTADNLAGRLPIFIAEAGFTEVVEAECFQTLFGQVCLSKAAKPLSN